MTERMDFEKFWEDNCLDSPLFEDAAQAVWESAQEELRTKLAACQAHNVELREAISSLMVHMRDPGNGVLSLGIRDNDNSRLALKRLFDLSSTTDTEALDAAIDKAVDSKLEDCVTICKEVAEGELILPNPQFQRGMEHGATRCGEIIEAWRKSQ